ncbi:hypothetical protein [Mesorhizobium sp. LCM 4576]|nr:hypothetical protein [Mesorhizobium sp. LCM 4576]
MSKSSRTTRIFPKAMRWQVAMILVDTLRAELLICERHDAARI